MAVDGGVFVRHADYRAEVLAGVRDILGDAVAERFSLKVQKCWRLCRTPWVVVHISAGMHDSLTNLHVMLC